MADDELNPYPIIGVRPDVDQRTLRAAYRAHARRVHPDVSDTEASRLAMVRLNQAWELVNTASRRAATDRRLRESGRLPTRPGDAAARPAAAPRRDVHRKGEKGWGAGAAGPPPGRPSGSKLDFGIYLDWSLGEVARQDPVYLEWLEGQPEGKPYLDEIKALKAARKAQLRQEQTPPRPARRRGLFNRG